MSRACSAEIPPQCAADPTSPQCSEYAARTPPSDCCMQLCRTVEQRGYLAQYCGKCTGAYGQRDARILPMPDVPGCDYQVPKTAISSIPVSAAPRRSTICVTEGSKTYAYTLRDTDAKGTGHFVYNDEKGGVGRLACAGDETLAACFSDPKGPGHGSRISNPYLVGGSATTLLAVASIYKMTAGTANTDITEPLPNDLGSSEQLDDIWSIPPTPQAPSDGIGTALPPSALGTASEANAYWEQLQQEAQDDDPRPEQNSFAQQMARRDGVGQLVPFSALRSNRMEEAWAQFQAAAGEGNQGSLLGTITQQQNTGADPLTSRGTQVGDYDETDVADIA